MTLLMAAFVPIDVVVLVGWHHLASAMIMIERIDSDDDETLHAAAATISI